jgi:outer membrane receptor for ferrienterochelin and colicin
MVAKEMGFRYSDESLFSIDLAFFHNDYDSLISQQQGSQSCMPHGTSPPCNSQQYFQIATEFANNTTGYNYGFEFVIDSQLNERIHVGLNYAQLRQAFRPKSGTLDLLTAQNSEMNFPSSKIHLYGNFKLSEQLTFHSQLYYVGDTSFVAMQTTQFVDSYLSLDSQLHWRVNDDIKLSLIVNNVFDNKHIQTIATSGIEPAIQQRSFFVNLQWLF